MSAKVSIHSLIWIEKPAMKNITVEYDGLERPSAMRMDKGRTSLNIASCLCSYFLWFNAIDQGCSKLSVTQKIICRYRNTWRLSWLNWASCRARAYGIRNLTWCRWWHCPYKDQNSHQCKGEKCAKLIATTLSVILGLWRRNICVGCCRAAGLNLSMCVLSDVGCVH